MAFFKKCGRFQLRKLGLNFIVFNYFGLVLFSIFNGNSRVKYYMPDLQHLTFQKNVCTVHNQSLGLINGNLNDASFVINNAVSYGGKWQPTKCKPIQTVAIIVPYRDRYLHLNALLNKLHPMLQKQMLKYHIYVIEQYGKEDFNRGRLLNIGAHFAMNSGENFDCYIFHDVDLIPEHEGNFYVCDDQLRHLASAIDEMRYHVMYYNYVGGVVATNKQNLLAINGYSNDFWGWGSEDDDFSARSIGANLLITRPPETIGRYKMVRHHKQWRTDNGYERFLSWRSRWKVDGLNNIEMKFKLLSKSLQSLYTNITVDLGKPNKKQYEQHPTMSRESIWWFLQFFFP